MHMLKKKKKREKTEVKLVSVLHHFATVWQKQHNKNKIINLVMLKK